MLKVNELQNKEDDEEEQDIEPKKQDQKLANILSIEEAMQKVGEQNRYQIKSMIISFITWFVTTYGYMVLPYFFSPPEFQCNINNQWVTCTEDDYACNPTIQVNILNDQQSSITTDFKLYCNNDNNSGGRQTRIFLQSLPLFAGIIGTFTFGYISDQLGRKYAIRLCWIIGIIFSLIMNFSNNIVSLTIGLFGVGFSALILQNLFIIHMNELSSGRFRVMAMLGMYIFWSISEMQYIWMLQVLPSWKQNMFCFYTIPLVIIFIISYHSIHDSPRYLYQKNRKSCIQQLNYIAKINKKEQQSINYITETELKQYEGNINRNYNYYDLFYYPSQRKNTIFISIVFLFVNFLYQGTQIILNTIGNSFGENSLYVGIGELIGFILSDFISHKIPRKKGIFYSLGITCIILMSFSLYDVPNECQNDSCWQKCMQGIMVSLARAITSLTFGLELLMCGEMYPATLKSLGFGFNIAIGYLGTFLAPSAVNIANILGVQPIVFIGVISFVGNFFTLFLNETINNQPILDIPEVQLQFNIDQINQNNSINSNNYKNNMQFNTSINNQLNGKKDSVYPQQTSQDNYIQELSEKEYEEKQLNQ